MLDIEIPGYGSLSLYDMVLDYNGTLACDGKLLEGVRERLDLLSERIRIHVLTADTFGGVALELAGVSCEVSVIPHQDQIVAKAHYIRNLGAKGCVAIGNGRNDHAMLKEAALGIAVVQTEGASSETILASDILTPSITDALDLLLYPLRLTATLRS